MTVSEEAAVSRFDRSVQVDGEAASAAARFRAEPARWLPAAEEVHGVHEFGGHLRLGPVVTTTRFTVGDPWTVAGTTIRTLEARFGGEPPDRILGELQGEVTVSPARGGGTAVRWQGTTHLPARGARRRVARALVGAVVRVTTRVIAERLSRPIGGASGNLVRTMGVRECSTSR
jgi:hypothetical protein